MHAAGYIRRDRRHRLTVPATRAGRRSRRPSPPWPSSMLPTPRLLEYTDWGISGRKDDRPSYVRLKAAIEGGEVCCLFAYSLRGSAVPTVS